SAMTAVRRALTLSAAAMAAVDLYLLVLLAGAVRDARRSPGLAGPRADPPRAIVLVPAHDEETTLPATLGAISGLDHPPDRLETIVVADNCTDRTAGVAIAAGATVWERDDPERRGKGHALRW